MKIPLARCVVLMLALFALGAGLHAATESQDPIVGDWFWVHDSSVTFNADGTCTGSGKHGIWQFLDNPEAERNYKITWNDAQYVDMLVLSEDAQTGHVNNDRGGKFKIRRKVKPRANGDGITAQEPLAKAEDGAGASGLLGAREPLPKDPLLGQWNWDGSTVIRFNSDGTCEQFGVARGKWKPIPGQGVGKYQIVWGSGGFVDDLTLSQDGQTLGIQNNRGGGFTVHRIPSN